MILISENILSDWMKRKQGAIERVLGAKLPRALLDVLKMHGIPTALSSIDVPGKKKDELKEEVMRHYNGDADLLQDEPKLGVVSAIKILAEKDEISYLCSSGILSSWLDKNGFPPGKIFTSFEEVLKYLQPEKVIAVGEPGKKYRIRSIGIGSGNLSFDLVVDKIEDLEKAFKLLT
jgi:hypothetical protein